MTAEDWNLRSVLKSWAIYLTRRWNGSLRIRSSVLFWYLLISRRATVPGLYLWGFLTPPVAGADFLAALVASCFLGAFPPVDFLAVCLVRAMLIVQMKLMLNAGLTSLICALCRQNRWRCVWRTLIFPLLFNNTVTSRSILWLTATALSETSDWLYHRI